MRVCFITLVLTLWTGAAQAADWQVVLLKPTGCNDCGFLEEILKRAAQLHTAVLEDGGSQVTAAVVRRSPPELAAQEWSELRSLPYFDESTWRKQAAAGAAQVLLRRDGVIVSAGNITDSADLRDARFPEDLTTPDMNRDLFAVRNARAAYVSDLYLRSWNLNWFYRLAMDPTLLRSRNGAAWVAGHSETLESQLGPVNVLLMSTASGAVDNEIFNALRIEEVRDVLARSLAPDAAQLRIFYGGGNTQGADALEVRGQRFGLIRRDVDTASPFTPDAALRIFQTMHARPGSRNLLVLIGHGGPDGAGMWGSPTPLSPGMLRALHEQGGGDDVLVSGNCFGGVMARSTSCGFFAARPDIVATGCQADAAEVAQSADYLHTFFQSLTPAGRQVADADGDGVITFAEAHWYASTAGDTRNVTYTSIDALADAWFETHPQALPPTITVRELHALRAGAPPAEAWALKNLLAEYDASIAVPLDGLAAQAMRWRPDSGLPRPLLGQLARRLLFQKNAKDQTAELARLQSCENRSVAAFLKP